MDQTAIRVPEVTTGTRYSFLYAVYLHTTAAALRTLVSYVNGRHEGFDKDLEISTPGLGSGKVNVSVCFPSRYKEKANGASPLPLVLVLEGGGFVLGQPKDRRQNDRLIADEVWQSNPQDSPEPNYFILGRANIDSGLYIGLISAIVTNSCIVIKSGGYKISALDIEREILGLPYVEEVMVVGVPDEEFGQRVAAAIVLTEGSLTIDTLRRDLRSRLTGYRMPTLLRVVNDLPKTASGKVMKKVLGPQLFPQDHQEVQRWTSGRI
jgi:hypothetical protein